jgi:EAL domain-containing protein (putative c-di-GMP-specific phosphodiesterase class I)
MRRLSRSPQKTPDTQNDPRVAALPAPELPSARVAEALHGNRIVLAFQPVHRAHGPRTRPAFHEALLRLRLPCGRVLTPGQFMGPVMDTPLGRALDRRALTLALDTLAAVPDLRLSVNVDPRTLEDPGWQALLRARLQPCPALAERLILEVTEHAVLPGPAALAAPLAQWRAWGISLALDDFGAGHTAFRQLRDWRFDIIKIDGAFSRDVHRDPDNQALLRALVGLARHFEALSVAEAVEDPADAAWLAACGVDALQGYHLGRPTLCPRWPGEPAALQAR